MDFFFWEYLKGIVFQTLPQNEQDLVERIFYASNRITEETMERIPDSMRQRSKQVCWLMVVILHIYCSF